ncbi:MAG: hypothetical protein LBK82_02850 [Planctomycetaceae bacterium]|nr:hypothetical protein [Planctomycetaceae bacterium]
MGNLSLKGCPPDDCLPLTKIPLEYYSIILRFRWETSNPVESEYSEVQL